MGFNNQEEWRMSRGLVRLLVVGGSGFIGRHVVNYATKLGWHVTSLNLSLPHDRLVKSSSVHHLSVDITNSTALEQTLGSNAFEYVVNCSGYIDHTQFFSGGKNVFHTHFDGVLNLVEFLDREVLQAFINIGSSDEYGNTPAPQIETQREAPISPYSIGKVAATHFLQMLWRTEQFPAITLRPFLIYGPGQGERRFLPQIIYGCLQDQHFPVSQGRQLRDFCYVDDIVEGIFCAIDTPAVCGRVINLASGTPVTIRAVIEQICDIIGQGRSDFGKIPYRIGENMALWADINLARELLGWTPKVLLNEGLARTVEYYRSKKSAV